MPVQIQLDDVEIAFKLDNLSLRAEQVSYGIFNDSCTRHHHGSHFYEAHLICGGKGALIVDNTEYPLHTGHLYMTGPNIDHEQLTDPHDPMAEYCLGIEIKKLKNTPATAFSNILSDTHFWFGEDKNGECRKLFERLEWESLHRSIGYAINVQSIVSSILVELVRNYTGYAPSDRERLSTPDAKRMLVIDNCFLSQYADITEENLSRILNLSTRQLQRFLKENYGKTFVQMRQTARLNKAAELLEKSVSIEEAASLVGYDDASYFKQLFRRFPR